MREGRKEDSNQGHHFHRQARENFGEFDFPLLLGNEDDPYGESEFFCCIEKSENHFRMVVLLRGENRPWIGNRQLREGVYRIDPLLESQQRVKRLRGVPDMSGKLAQNGVVSKFSSNRSVKFYPNVVIYMRKKQQ